MSRSNSSCQRCWVRLQVRRRSCVLGSIGFRHAHSSVGLQMEQNLMGRYLLPTCALGSEASVRQNRRNGSLTRHLRGQSEETSFFLVLSGPTYEDYRMSAMDVTLDKTLLRAFGTSNLAYGARDRARTQSIDSMRKSIIRTGCCRTRYLRSFTWSLTPYSDRFRL